MTDKTDSKEREPTYLCQAWGETDLPSAAIVQGLDAVREFLVEQWLGDADQEHDDGTKALPAAMADMQEQWALEGEAWKWSISFEIGGISVQRVDNVGRASLAANAGREPVASRAFLERALSAMEGVIDVADRQTDEFEALRSCVIDLTLMLFKERSQREARPCHVFTVRKAGPLTEWEPTTMAFALPDGEHALYTHPSPPEGMVGGLQVYRCKIKSRKQIDREIPREQQGWWADVAAGQKLLLRQAVQSDLDRCTLGGKRSRNPADYMCETHTNGSLVSKVALEYMNPEQNVFAAPPTSSADSRKGE